MNRRIVEKVKRIKIIQPFLFLCLIIIWNEYLVYYVVISRCKWPQTSKSALRTFMIADTHLLGPYKGHWADKIRREWQMWRSFQSSMTLHSPDAVFFLGDIFDEGQWCDKTQFDTYAARFNQLFKVDQNVKRVVVVGNHDVGFHYAIHPDRLSWFGETYANSTPVGTVTIKGQLFVLVNSMAMHGDYCQLCHSAEIEIDRIGNELYQVRPNNIMETTKETDNNLLSSIVRPTLLMHFPMYRESDMVCEGGSELNDLLSRQKDKFRQLWDCLSKESTHLLINKLKPKAVFDGHVHYGCKINHTTFTEHTVASYSWRNNQHPSFLLTTFDGEKVISSVCFLPSEVTVIWVYIGSAITFTFLLFFKKYRINVNLNRYLLIERPRLY